MLLLGCGGLVSGTLDLALAFLFFHLSSSFLSAFFVFQMGWGSVTLKLGSGFGRSRFEGIKTNRRDDLGLSAKGWEGFVGLILRFARLLEIRVRASGSSMMGLGN